MIRSLLAVPMVLSLGATSAQVATPQVVNPSRSSSVQLGRTSTAMLQSTHISAPAFDTSSLFDTYKDYLAQRARSAGVREATVQAYLPTLQINQRAIDLDRSQMPTVAPASGPEPLTVYIQEHVTTALITNGRRHYYSDWPNLVRIYQRYGVDPAILMAIYGEETRYGAVTGNFDLLEVLATLAYEGRRRVMFEDEFVSALKLIDGGVPREQLKGSYAGATGYPQFMPSLALQYRADGDGDGYADIWSNELDALASIANVFHEYGWKTGMPWGSAVRLPATLNREAIRSTAKAERCPAAFRRLSRWMTVADWEKLGVTFIGKPLPSDEMAALLEANGFDGTGHLLTGNYRVILHYNCSNYYAMSVGLLSDGIAGR